MDSGVPAVQSLVENGTAHVPQRFVRPIHDRPSKFSSPDLDDIPVINASQLSDKIELQKLDNACREWGFFQLTDHGIPRALMQSARGVIREFFRLPQEEKESYTASSTKLRREGYGRYFLPSKDTVLDWGDVFFHALPPVALPWPVHPAEYKETIQAYGAQVRSLALKLLAALSRALGQPPELFGDAFGPDAHSSLRMNYYPPCPEPDLVLGLSPHSDGVGITILLQDEVEGLQIRKNGEWKPVKSMPDAFVVNIGDILEVMSNGIYKSVEHRATVSSGNARMSAAFFFSPGFEAVLKPLVPDEKPLFRELTFREFITAYMGNALNGKQHLEYAKL
ncbi:2-oxoglutarate, iron(II)-dependent oxygenase [Selaginella moellendorffii]|uniref:2-oxoglutarate, iron(II)-dependent oxygenase n=1 Tax=Selaginella moellendorffii TaxID=88036 RepID=D8RSG0_SELML|nr:protein SRG1 [Selaginella moellendorffii]EFJ24858.1 2-oxoglutarate, iron(II)-dependent oxygenase [Selaginella moellendorffii]|eukprot:XP_002973903.1 protein SRG1 [Selaginella moellendorffii]